MPEVEIATATRNQIDGEFETVCQKVNNYLQNFAHDNPEVVQVMHMFDDEFRCLSRPVLDIILRDMQSQNRFVFIHSY